LVTTGWLRLRVVVGGVVVVAGLLLPSVRATAATSAVQVAEPVGFATFRDLDQLPYLSRRTDSRQFSSFDRAGGNDEYGRVLSAGADGSVIAEHQGAGEVDRIWVTAITDGRWGDVSGAGRIKIQLDGQTVVNAPLIDVVNGTLGPPFSYPLVANSEQSSGAVYIAVPMPYRTSMRITTEASPAFFYFHVSYRTFPDATGITTFSPSADRGEDVLRLLQTAGTRDPKPAASGATTQRGSTSIDPGQSVTLAQTSGAGSLRSLQLRIPQAGHTAPTPISDDGRAFGGWVSSSQFTIALDPGNTGVRLTRRLDPGIGNQIANVRVDGVFVGQWSPMSVSSGNWAEQTLSLPASETAGKTAIVIRNEYYSSDWDINEFGYWADQQVGGVWNRADTVDVGPDHTATEAAHAYQITNPTWAGRRSYRAPAPAEVTDDGRAYWGSSRFNVAIDPANTGVRLTRRFDSGIANQRVNVVVDGMNVGQWTRSVSAPYGGFIDDSLELPASLTAGKSQLTVENSYVSSDWDVNEFIYWADSHVAGGMARSDTVDVGNIASESAHGYAITDQTWSGTRTYRYLDDDLVLNGLRIRISFDGTTMVDAPVGEFFGSARGEFDVRSLMSAVDVRLEGWYSSWWPMPYRTGATVALYNGSPTRVSTAEWAVTSVPDPRWGTDLASGRAGYFHATSRVGTTVAGQDWPLLQTNGHGKIVAVSQGGDAADSTFLEGDERVYLNGSKTPQIHGTGTEDFYNGGFYFLHGPVANPLAGESSDEVNGSGGCPSGRACRGLYRQMLADAIHFRSAVTFGIEHGPVDNVTSSYSTTVLWYGRSNPAQAQTDLLTVGNAASEQAHQYTSTNPGPVTSLTSDYEGNDAAPVMLTKTTRATTAPISFSLTVNAANTGVILRRTSDQNTSYQRATVTVDGVPVGQWLQPLGNTTHRWLDDDFQLPASATTGKSSIRVTLTPAVGAPAWSAAAYRGISIEG
jgi:hypothetical protein